MLRLLHRYLVRQTMPAVAVAYYGKMCAGIADFYLGPLVEEINREFAQGTRILDVGTGTGHLPVMLARRAATSWRISAEGSGTAGLG